MSPDFLMTWRTAYTLLNSPQNLCANVNVVLARYVYCTDYIYSHYAEFVRIVTTLILPPIYFTLDNFNVLEDFINLNCITNSCNRYTYVTWRGNEHKLSEDDTIVSKHVAA